MKRYLSMLLALLLCLGCLSCAHADDRAIDSAFFQCADWKPEDVDVSGVREENGRLVGVVKLPATNKFGYPTAELRVDCPLPTDFTAEQRARLHVAYKALTKQDVQAALKAIGQKVAPDAMYAYNNADQSTVDYTGERHIDSCFFTAQLCDASRSDDPAYADEYAQAKSVTRQLVEALGGDVCEPLLHASRRDSAHAYPYSDTASSEGDASRRRWEERFAAEEAKCGRTDEPYTPVIGLYELRGLPVMDQYYWQDGDGDWMGASCGFQAVVRDDGTVCHFQINGVPEVVSAEPIALPEYDWRELLRQSVAYLCISNAKAQDTEYENIDGEKCVAYATYPVIIDLKPCWVSHERGVLEPGWYCVTEERVTRDDSVLWIWSQYGDAETLMSLGQ